MTGVADNSDRSILITVRARLDPAFPGRVFVSLRRYGLASGEQAEAAAEFAAIDQALDEVQTWLNDFTTE